MNAPAKFVIGSRESKLAVIQSEMVMDYIRRTSPQTEVSLLTMKTTGDIILDRTLDKVGGKGLFVKELDRALLDKRSDLSVHSLKDMPMEVDEQLPIVGFSKREDPRDVLVLPEGTDHLNFEKPIGCSSLRRILQLKELFPQAEFKSVRGNVLTRLRKLDEGQYSALVLAAAGLKRLGLENGSAATLNRKKSSLPQARGSSPGRDERRWITISCPALPMRQQRMPRWQNVPSSVISTADVLLRWRPMPE